jgi:hypothetical protein
MNTCTKLHTIRSCIEGQLLWALGEGRLEEERLVDGIRRRLYSKEVAGLGPGPRRRGGATGSSRRARGGRDEGQVTDTTCPPSL